MAVGLLEGGEDSAVAASTGEGTEVATIQVGGITVGATGEDHEDMRLIENRMLLFRSW